VTDHHVEFQRTFYDRHFGKRAAAVRDQLGHPLFRSFNDRVAELVFALGEVGDGRPVRLLEVGCGEGLLAAAIHRKAEERGVELDYSGADVSAAALELARSHVPGDLVVGDAVELLDGMAAGSQDVIVAKNLLHHLDDPATFLREAGRVVGPSGRLVIFEPNLGCPQFLLFNVLAFRRERYYFFGRRRNLDALRRAGLRVLRTELFSWLPYELAFVIRFDWFRRLLSFGSPRAVAAISRLDERLTRWLPALACYVVWATAPSPNGDGVPSVEAASAARARRRGPPAMGVK
jgi:SAM-dependent methyltransferase